MFLRFIDLAVLVFSIIGLDSSTSDTLRRDIRITIEDMIASLESAPVNIGSMVVGVSSCLEYTFADVEIGTEHVQFGAKGCAGVSEY